MDAKTGAHARSERPTTASASRSSNGRTCGRMYYLLSTTESESVRTIRVPRFYAQKITSEKADIARPGLEDVGNSASVHPCNPFALSERIGSAALLRGARSSRYILDGPENIERRSSVQGATPTLDDLRVTSASCPTTRCCIHLAGHGSVLEFAVTLHSLTIVSGQWETLTTET